MVIFICTTFDHRMLQFTVTFLYALVRMLGTRVFFLYLFDYRYRDMYSWWSWVKIEWARLFKCNASRIVGKRRVECVYITFSRFFFLLYTIYIYIQKSWFWFQISLSAILYRKNRIYSSKNTLNLKFVFFVLFVDFILASVF